jgi:hypothetical protein
MTDGVTPRCVYCGETVELVDHIERLNAHQPFIDWMHQAVPDAEFRANAKCGACREDPERAIEMMSRVSTEELRARMRGEWNR